ncbi:methyltransferase [Amycolatopsis sp. OK19-0408]|uniref:Methyltransferase n=2 Tax=Amycolatopsis iheyensis TaxID=2945988 RepID=A0A9X2SPG7_9PSEU|nr:methyltransferase [Amycolatopsis iheyensis]
MAGLATPMALRVAATLDLPGHLDGEGGATGPLAAELGVSPVALELLLSHLTTLGCFERTAAGYRTTAFGAKIRAGLTGVLLDLNAAGGRAELAFVELLHSVTTGEGGYARRYGQDFWTDLAERPPLRESFDRQMALRFRGEVAQLVGGFDWGRFASVVDVGGGQGELLAGILTAQPGVRGWLVDLEPTAAEAARVLSGFGARAEVVAGSFFDPLPAGADAYVLCDILHDWDDEHAHLVLARCVEALPAHGRLLVVEPVGDRWASTEIDLAMLVIFGGRERRVGEFEDLAAAHGLVLEAVTDVTGQRSLLEFRRADG